MRLYWGDPFFVSLFRRPTKQEEADVRARGQSLGFNYDCPGASRDLVWPDVNEDCDEEQRRNAETRHRRRHRGAPPLPLPDNARRDAAGNGTWAVDRARVKVGYGRETYLQTRDFVKHWGAFQLPWARVDADVTGTRPGASGVCVAARLLGGLVWTAVPLQVTVCEEQRRWQVLRPTRRRGEEEGQTGGGDGWETQPSSARRGSSGNGGGSGRRRFLLAHGCLRSHFLAGEERFAVEWHRPPKKKKGFYDQNDDDDLGPVYFEVATFSRPAHPLAALGYPVVRALQAAYRHDATRHVARTAAVATVDRSTGGVEAAGPWWETEMVGAGGGGGGGGSGGGDGPQPRRNGWVGVLTGLVAGAGAAGGAAARAGEIVGAGEKRRARKRAGTARRRHDRHCCPCCGGGGGPLAW
jgi:uncharacterized protein (UPF0548 family)